MDVPADWNPGVIEGNARNGYCRIDDAEMPRIELKWETNRRSRPMQDIVDRYLKIVIKDAKKKRLHLRVRRDTHLVEIPDADCECFECRADTHAVNLAVRYGQRGRVVVVRLLSRPSERIGDIAKRVLGSLREHSGDGPRPWSVYGLRLQAPKFYVLSKEIFLAGRVEMVFRAKTRSAHAARVGLAEVVLRRQSLKEWLDQDPIGKLDCGKTKAVETSAHGHEAIEITGSRPRGVWRFFPRHAVTQCRAWHCERSNALYVARWRGPVEEQSEFTDFADSFACHAEG